MNVIGQLGTFRVSLLTEPWPLCQILIILTLKQDCGSGRLGQILIVCWVSLIELNCNIGVGYSSITGHWPQLLRLNYLDAL